MNPPAPRLLFVTRHSPLPGEHGSGAYAFALLRHLAAEGFAVTCLWVNHALNGKRGWCLVPPEADAVYELAVPGYLRVGPLLLHPWLLVRNLLKQAWRAVRPKSATTATPAHRGGAGAWNAPASSRETRLAAQVASVVRPDVALLNYYWLAGLCPGVPRRAVLSHDVFHQRGADMAAAAVQVNARAVSAAEEGSALARAGLVVAITEEDAATFREILPPGHPVVVAPMAVDVVSHLDGWAEVPGRCLFVGGESLPNVDGLRWFLEHAWPLVRRLHPAATLHVCGKVGDGFAGEHLPGVVLRGLVPSLDDEYAQAQVVIVPLRVGSGMKIKLVEAMARGRACVATSVGLQGLGFLGQSDVLRADEPGEFARAVGWLLEEDALRELVAEGGRRAAAARLSPEQAYAPLVAALTPAPVPALPEASSHAR